MADQTAAVQCVVCKLIVSPATSVPLNEVLKDLWHEGAIIESDSPLKPEVTCPACAEA